VELVLTMARLAAKRISLEVFVPRSEVGVAQLRERLAEWVALGPTLLSVSGAPDSVTLELAQQVQQTHCVRVQLQLTGEMTVAAALEFVEQALSRGLCDVLLPPGAAEHTMALVSTLKARFGNQVRVAVSVLLHAAASEHAATVKQLALQVAAGAELVQCVPCFEAATVTRFVADVRAAGVQCEVVAGLMPIRSHAELKRAARQLGIEVPAWLQTELRALADTAVPAYGDQLCARLCTELMADGVVPLVCTLNQRDTLAMLQTAGYRPLKHRTGQALVPSLAAASQAPAVLGASA
tara:strand:- start:117 stop:1001 length:885 start_codon:yes stop_codon:yes gene_type:complete